MPLAAALDAAAQTDGLVDPTLGRAMADLGYDRDFALLPSDSPAAVRIRRLADWRTIELDVARSRVRIPAGVRLDLGATAKAFAADRAARDIQSACGGAVLVGLGGDITVAGPAPAGGWAVRVQDRTDALDIIPAGPFQVVSITAGGLATSSVTARQVATRRGRDAPPARSVDRHAGILAVAHDLGHRTHCSGGERGDNGGDGRAV